MGRDTGIDAPGLVAVWPGVAGGFCGQPGGHPLGHARGHAAGAGRRAVGAVVERSSPQPAAVHRMAAVAGAVALGCGVFARSAAVGGRGGGGRGGAVGHALALAPAFAGAAFAVAGAVVAARAARSGAV